MSYDKPEMADLFELYHDYLLQTDRDPKTIERYWQIVKTFKEWLGSRRPSPVIVAQYLAHLRSKGYAQRSVLLYYHGLQGLFNFMNQPLKLKLRKPKTLPQYHSKEEIETLITQAQRGLYHETEAQRRRNTTMILTFAYTGMRREEVANLQVIDVDFERKIIMVRDGKGQKDRVIPMADRIIVPLKELCAGKAKHDKVFSLSAGRIYWIVRKLAEKAGIGHFHPHSARHFFGTALVERGASLRDIQEIMGHESLETTAIYLDVCGRHLAETVALLDNPREPSNRPTDGRSLAEGRRLPVLSPIY